MTTSSPQAVADRLEGLRNRATTDASGAQADTWAWIEQLGEARNGDELESLFSIGTVPQGLDGPTDGILVCTLTNPLVDLPVRMLTSAWMPWQGKTFNAAQATGINRMTVSSLIPGRILFPLYGMKDAPDDGKLAFDFVTRAEAGAVEPSTNVMVIDYEPVNANPDLIIRQIRDELVELVPDTYLGRILFKLPRGGYTNIGYFALKQPTS